MQGLTLAGIIVLWQHTLPFTSVVVLLVYELPLAGFIMLWLRLWEEEQALSWP